MTKINSGDLSQYKLLDVIKFIKAKKERGEYKENYGRVIVRALENIAALMSDDATAEDVMNRLDELAEQFVSNGDKKPRTGHIFKTRCRKAFKDFLDGQ
jgi:hypothetical protein